MAITRGELVKRIARRFGHYHAGTASSGGTTSIVDTTLLEPDDFWINHFAYITDTTDDAAPISQERTVTDFVQSTGTLTVNPAFSAAVGLNDTYEILPVRRSAITAAIDEGYEKSSRCWPIPASDTSTITLAADDYEYSLPTDVMRLLTVAYRGDTDEPWVELEASNWWVTGVPGAQSLNLHSLDGLDAGDTLKLEYIKRPAALASDASALGIGDPADEEVAEFLVSYALDHLHQQAASANPTSGEFRAHLTLADMYHRQWNELVRRSQRWQRSGRVHWARRAQVARG